MKATKQRAAFGFEEEDESHDDEIFVIRRLRVPPSPQDQEWLTADAMQIEYRLFARYANNKEVIEAYRKDPLMSFHKYMHKRVLVYKTDQTYKQQKDLNFSYIYGAQLLKQALMLGHVTQREYLDIKRTKKYFDNPKLANTKEVRRIFDQELPEVKGLLERASFLAKPQCDDRCYERFGKMKGKLSKLHETEQHRGFVTTLLGRRGRFPDGQRLHKAFNIVVQGGAADIMKQKLVELHEQRKYTGLTLCYTVHDEADGYTPKDPVHARRVQEVLNAQSFPELSIPILWEVETGPNWAQCKAPEAQMSGLEETRAQLNYINTGRNRP
jgi:DNA polymerase I-like protein with 3'-5' exonuclease and polymerase domains